LSLTKERFIFLIDDDAGDRKLISRSIQKFDPDIKVENFSDGTEVINFFESKKKTNSFESLPDLILLDLNMPKVPGIEILKYIKSEDNFRKIPIIAFTTSNAQTDVNLCFDNYISGYFIKPTTFNEFGSQIEKILNYWFKGSFLPLAGGASLFSTTQLND
jgi:CheY-like chemotaxis protein